jgi:hypothetical protein
MKNLFTIFVGVACFILGCFMHGCNCGQPGFEKMDTVSNTTTVAIDHQKDSTSTYVPGIDFIEGGKIPDGPQAGDIIDYDPAHPPRGFARLAGVAPGTSSDGGSVSWAIDPSFVTLAKMGGVDTAAIIAQYLQRVGYKDTVHTRYGFMRIYDTVYRNRIIARQVFTDFDIPVYTNTITLRDKPRNQVFVGVGGMWNVQKRLLGVGPSLMFKAKNDHVIELGAMANTAGELTAFFSMKFKISLKNHNQ